MFYAFFRRLLHFYSEDCGNSIPKVVGISFRRLWMSLKTILHFPLVSLSKNACYHIGVLYPCYTFGLSLTEAYATALPDASFHRTNHAFDKGYFFLVQTVFGI